MVWDKSLPSNDEKIRSLGTVIRPNWEAIEEADSTLLPWAFNYVNRDSVAGPISSDPSAISDAYLIYCKEDGAGNPELYVIDESGNSTQMTRGTPSTAATGRTFLPGGLLMQWGYQAVPAGTSSAISFSTPFTTAVLNVQLTIARNASDTSATPVVDTATLGLSSFKVILPAGANNNNCYWLAIGY